MFGGREKLLKELPISANGKKEKQKKSVKKGKKNQRKIKKNMKVLGFFREKRINVAVFNFCDKFFINCREK